MRDLEARVAQLELNQHRLAILATDAPEEHKAWDRVCLMFDLTFTQEIEAKRTILDFLGSTNCDMDYLLDRVTRIVGHPVKARDIVSAFKKRGTAAERWRAIDPLNEL